MSYNRLTLNYDVYLKELQKLAKEKNMFKNKIKIKKNDVLIIVDMQNDFIDYEDIRDNPVVEGTFGQSQKGNFAVLGSDKMIVNQFNNIIKKFADKGAEIIATKDYHPPWHCSFNYDLYPLFVKSENLKLSLENKIKLENS